MSRTEKTAPPWVKIHEYPVEHHDHREGICDLPPLELRAESLGFRRGAHCYWDGQWDKPTMYCGCPMCTMQDERRRERRRERREGKRQAREWWREW